MTLQEAEAIFRQHCDNAFYPTRNVMFIGKTGTTEVRTLNLDEATPEFIEGYAKYLQERET